MSARGDADEARRRLAARDQKLLNGLGDAYGVALAAVRSEAEKIAARVAEARRRGEPVDEAWLVRERQLDRLEETARARVQAFAKKAAATVDGAVLDEAAAGREDAAAVLRATLPPGSRVALDAIVELVAEGGRLRLILDTLPQDAAQRVRAELIRSVAVGRNPRRTAAAIRDSLGGNLARALTIARTETISAYRDASLQTYRATNGVDGWVWDATLDRSTCAVCWAMHGTVHPLDETFDSHPNCFPAGTTVAGPTALAATARFWRGELVELETASGRRLSVTPNHPLLTAEGWVEAGLVNEGDQLVNGASAERVMAGVDPDHEQVPALIEQVGDALRRTGRVTAARVPTTAEDFHGDGMDGEVDVVRADGLLGSGLVSAIEEPTVKQAFSRGDAQAALLASARSPLETLNGIRVATASGVCESCETAVLVGGALFGEDSVGFGSASPLDTVPFEESLHGGPADAVRLGKGLLRVSGAVSLDQVVRVSRRPFEGQVFNLQTVDGWYSANGFIVHNCRCSPLPLTRPWADLGVRGVPETRFEPVLGETLFARLPAGRQREVLGPGKLDAYRDGRITLADLVQPTVHPVYGRGLRERPLRGL